MEVILVLDGLQQNQKMRLYTLKHGSCRVSKPFVGKCDQDPLASSNKLGTSSSRMQLKSKRWVIEQCQSLLVQGCRMPTQKHFYLQPKKSICNKSLPMWFAKRLRVFKLLYNARGGMIRSPTPEKYATVDKGFIDRTTKAAISASPPNNW